MNFKITPLKSGDWRINISIEVYAACGFPHSFSVELLDSGQIVMTPGRSKMSRRAKIKLRRSWLRAELERLVEASENPANMIPLAGLTDDQVRDLI